MLTLLENIKKRINNDKKLVICLVIGITLIGIFLRVYQYHDWLFFKWDQARDATLISKSIENGSGELPLLGPRATKVGEDYLRLGPAFYYAQYFFGALFNSTKPVVFAFSDTFFAILTIPLLYFFLRLYFSRFNSILGIILYTFSFLVVQYSRFAWNPNAVPFWMLASFYGMLRTLKDKNFKNRLIWFAVFTFSFAVATQYHFFAMFGLLGIIPVFLFFKLKVWKIKDFLEEIKEFFSQKMVIKKVLTFVLTFVLIFGIIYSPVIISDTKTNWSNTKNFIGAFSEKPRDDKTLKEKVVRNFREQAKNYTLLTTSFWTRKGKKADPYPVIFGLFLIASGIAIPLYRRRKIKDQNKKDFLLLIPIWIIMFFLITISTAYQLRPRYFTPVFPVPFIILVFWMSCLQKKFIKNGLIYSLIIFIAFLLMNVYGTAAWFKDNILAQKQNFPTDRNFILKKDDGITLGQLERVTDYMIKNKKGNEIVFYSKAEYSLPIEYLIKQKNNKIDIYFIADSKDLIGHSDIFAVNTIKGGYDSVSKKVKNYGKKISTEEFGEMVVFEMILDKDKLRGLSVEIKEEEEEEDEDSLEGENEDEGKTERLFWKDVL